MLAIGLVAALGMYLFLQPGAPLDEPEHLHVAWLMVHLGLRPIHDFFEHHTPLLWHVLGLAYRAGVSGPEVLYFGRALTLACAALWVSTLFALVRRWSGGQRGGLFALASFALTAVFAPDLVVTRPETLAMALLALALLCWTAPSRKLWLAAAAGALLALSACASPRFALFAPALFIAGPDGVPAVALRAIAAAIAGGCAAVAAFIAALCPWQDLLFDLRYSSLLQRIGTPGPLDYRYIGVALVFFALIWGALIATARAPKRAAALWAVHGGSIAALCAMSSGRYLYPQALAPALVWMTLFAAWLEAQPEAEGLEKARGLLLDATLFGSLAAVVVLLAAASSSYNGAAPMTASRRLLLDALPPGAHVLLEPVYHPITAADASYWGSALLPDSPGKACEAAAEYGRRYPHAAVQLPPCDLLADLRRNQPDAVWRGLPSVVPPEQALEIQSELESRYGLSHALDDAPTPTFPANILFRAPSKPSR